jgi:hypothetical protein
MKRAAFFTLSIFREIAIKMAILLILAAILVSAKVAFNYYFSDVCISGFGNYSQACIDPGPAPNLPDKSRQSR